MASDTGASAYSARSSRFRVEQGHGRPQPPQLQIGMTGPWVLTAHHPGNGRYSSGPADWSPNPLASLGTEPAATTMRGSRCTCRRALGRKPRGSPTPGRRSLLTLLWPVATIDWNAVPCAAGQVGSAAADLPPPPPGPDRPVPAGESQCGSREVFVVRDALHVPSLVDHEGGLCAPAAERDAAARRYPHRPPHPVRETLRMVAGWKG